MNEIYKKTSLVWSKQQDCFHIETLHDTVVSGVLSYIDRSLNCDYILIGVFDNYEDASEAFARLKEDHGGESNAKD